jgi:hypothetical protein
MFCIEIKRMKFLTGFLMQSYGLQQIIHHPGTIDFFMLVNNLRFLHQPDSIAWNNDLFFLCGKKRKSTGVCHGRKRLKLPESSLSNHSPGGQRLPHGQANFLRKGDKRAAQSRHVGSGSERPLHKTGKLTYPGRPPPGMSNPEIRKAGMTNLFLLSFFPVLNCAGNPDS